MTLEARSKFGVSLFEPEVCRKQMNCIEESTCDIVGTFRRPYSDSAPEKLCPPCPPSLRSWSQHWIPDARKSVLTHL